MEAHEDSALTLGAISSARWLPRAVSLLLRAPYKAAIVVVGSEQESAEWLSILGSEKTAENIRKVPIGRGSNHS